MLVGKVSTKFVYPRGSVYREMEFFHGRDPDKKKGETAAVPAPLFKM